MKTFNNFNSAFNWVDKIVSDTNKQAVESIAKQVYEDSKKYTYIDTQTMYDSGETSDFKGGYVLIKAPQVRRLYYGSYRGHKNANAVPQWFEATRIENIEKYKEMYIKEFNKEKE